MKKTLILTFVFALISFAKVWSQTEQPTTKPTPAPKDKTEQMKKAEEKSDGAAYSGKGGDKDMVEKDKTKKIKKAKKAKKAKKSKKEKAGDAQEEKPQTEKTRPGGTTDTPQPAGNKQAPQPKKVEPQKKPAETSKQRTSTSEN
ncbi:MAG: hypothetical protein OHK0019_30190 [Saprospiraceae bacterium]